MSADYEAPSEQDLNVCSHSRESRRRPVRRQGASSDGGERPQTPGSVLRRRGSVLRRRGSVLRRRGSVLRRRGASSDGGERPQAAGSVLRRQGASSDEERGVHSSCPFSEPSTVEPDISAVRV
ncbi:hypothetical protein KUCAC02_033173 [Chaenocephalus aceratus]|nr:hypothetical protein KUCAC02_033173 [Chaenocephalus aceratus]